MNAAIVTNPFPWLLAATTAATVGFISFKLLRALQTLAEKQRVESLLSDYGGIRGAGEAEQLRVNLAGGAVGRRLESLRRGIEQALFSAGLALPAKQWLGLLVLLGIAMFLTLWLILKSALASIVISAAFMVFAPKRWLASRGRARASRFAQDLPQALQILASALRSGLSFSQAFETLAKQDRGEVGTQFRQALTEVDYGSPLEPALKRVAERMSSLDLQWLVSALEIQREIGGSLSGILDTLAETIRGRAEVAREVRVLSAEGKLSAYILLALPILIAGLLAVIQPSYISFFWSEPIGWFLVLAATLLVIAGWFWLKRVIRVEV